MRSRFSNFHLAALVSAYVLCAVGLSAQAETSVCLGPKPGSPSASPGRFCGGPLPTPTGRSLDLNAECKALFGANASAFAKTQDAYGWVCRVQGQADRGIADMHNACRRPYGNDAIATLVGLGINDWRCLTPSDVAGHVVPILLYPVDHRAVDEIVFAADSIKRVNTLVSGVRGFYQEKTSVLVPGTNTFILLTRTSSVDWQNLALCTDQLACENIGNPYPWIPTNDVSRFRYLNRINTELKDGGWGKLISPGGAPGSMRLVAFVSLGASPAQMPTWCGAGDFPGGVAGAAPSNSYVSCSPPANNPPEYEDAFYGTAHELGHGMGLPHSDEYSFHDTNFHSRWLRPGNLQDSIMRLGKGTSSELFPFEAYKLQPFLLNWH